MLADLVVRDELRFRLLDQHSAPFSTAFAARGPTRNADAVLARRLITLSDSLRSGAARQPAIPEPALRSRRVSERVKVTEP
jgi:hypothetical protein